MHIQYSVSNKTLLNGVLNLLERFKCIHAYAPLGETRKLDWSPLNHTQYHNCTTIGFIMLRHFKRVDRVSADADILAVKCRWITKRVAQMLRATLKILNGRSTADLLAEERRFFGLIRDRLGTCERPQKLLRWFRAVTFAHCHRARDDGVDILLPDERKAAVAHPCRRGSRWIDGRASNQPNHRGGRSRIRYTSVGLALNVSIDLLICVGFSF